jgi:16S rRNA U1498 N3-methylase RsmE
MSNSHKFTLFYQELSNIVGSKTSGFVEFTDKELVNRIFKILRLKNGEHLTLFDNSINLDLEIIEPSGQSKNKLTGQILRLEQNKQISPEIILMPCLLKKEAQRRWP